MANVLEVRAGHAVARHDGPVIAQGGDFFGAHVDNRLNSQDQAFLQTKVILETIAVDEVRDLRDFVPDPANPVPDVLLDYAESL